MKSLSSDILALLFTTLIFRGSYSELVDEKSWLDFSDSGASATNPVTTDACPVRRRCLRLHRVTVRCDAELLADACGSCKTGFGEFNGRCRLVVAASAGDGGRFKVGSAADWLDGDTKLQLNSRSADSVNSSASSAPAPPPPPRPHPDNGDVLFFAIIGIATALAIAVIIVAAITWYKCSTAKKLAEEDFKGNDGTGEFRTRVSGGGDDGRLAMSAQMYHYQHQKNQLLAMQNSNKDSKPDSSDAETEDGNEDADYTVYECPGLASTGEMEVRNPLFNEEVVSTVSINGDNNG